MRSSRWCSTSSRGCCDGVHIPARYTTVESVKAKERWATSRVEAVSREAMAAIEAAREEALKEGKASATHPDEEWRGRAEDVAPLSSITPQLHGLNPPPAFTRSFHNRASHHHASVRVNHVYISSKTKSLDVELERIKKKKTKKQKSGGRTLREGCVDCSASFRPTTRRRRLCRRQSFWRR